MRTFFIEDKDKITKLIKTSKICYVAMSLNDVPYVLPMNFAYNENEVILHSAQNGRMWEHLKANPKVCINWTVGDKLTWQNERVGCSYRMISSSVIAEGEVEFINDYDEKEKCLHEIMAQYSNLGFKFNVPAVNNVGILKVHIQKLTAKEFGVKSVLRRKV